MSSIADQAISAIQKLLTSCMVLFVVFLLLFSSMSTALSNAKALSNLYAWLQLKNLAQSLPKANEDRRLDLHSSGCDPGYELRISGGKYTPECPYEAISVTDPA